MTSHSRASELVLEAVDQLAARVIDLEDEQRVMIRAFNLMTDRALTAEKKVKILKSILELRGVPMGAVEAILNA